MARVADLFAADEWRGIAAVRKVLFTLSAGGGPGGGGGLCLRERLEDERGDGERLDGREEDITWRGAVLVMRRSTVTQDGR